MPTYKETETDKKMKIKDIAERIDQIIPLKLAQDWDNVGLLIGEPNKNVKNVLLTIDVTKEVLAEAKKQKAELIISYHPIIWDGLKKIIADGPAEVVYELIRSGIAVFSIHTALDVISGGVNDGLAEIIGIRNAKPIGDYVEYPEGDNRPYLRPGRPHPCSTVESHLPRSVGGRSERTVRPREGSAK